MKVQRNTMSNNNKDSRQDDEGNNKDSNTTAQGGVWRRRGWMHRNWYNRTFSYSLGRLGKIKKTSVKMLLISLIFWVVFFIGAWVGYYKNGRIYVRTI